MKTEWGLREFWRKTFQCITLYSSRRTFSKTSRACPRSWKNSCAYKQTCAYAIVGHQCHSRFHILSLKAEDSGWLWTSQTHTHIYTHRDEHVFIPCIHIFSLSLSCSHTNTHARAGNQPASRFDTLPVLWSGQWRDGFSHHRLWSLREEEAVCVYMVWGKGDTDINSL